MSTPTQNTGGPSFDISQLPQQLQDYIKAEIAKAIAATQPPPPKELTPAEKAVLYLQQGEQGLRGERAISPGSLYVHDRILAVLDILVDTVFPQDQGVPDVPPILPESAV